MPLPEIDRDGEVHVFDNGLRLYRRHLSAIQTARYRTTNLHEPVEEDWFRRLSRGDSGPFRFADVGAGIGYYSILMKRLRPSARVFCFEPLGEHAERLVLNLTLNGIAREAVDLYEVAVSDRVGREAFHQENFGSRLVSVSTADSRLVDATTLAAVVDHTGGLELVKIDVQGDELRVIAGAGDAAPRIERWIVGTHSPDLHRDCLSALGERGLRILFDDQAPPHQPDGLIVAVSDRVRDFTS